MFDFQKKMEMYLSVVKGNCPDLKAVDDSATNIVRRWPSFMNLAVSKGYSHWDKYVTDHNYPLTVSMYTGYEFMLPYRDWIMMNTILDHGKILKHLAYWSSSMDFTDRYPKQFVSNKDSVLSYAIAADRVPLICKICSSSSSSDLDKLKNILYTSMLERSMKCVYIIAKQILSLEPKGVFGDIWAPFQVYNDYSLLHLLNKFIAASPLSLEDCSGNSDELRRRTLHKNVLMGSMSELTSSLESISSDPSQIVATIASRIPYEPRCADCLLQFVTSRELTKDNNFNASVASKILNSTRNPQDTLIIVCSLLDRGIIFSNYCAIDVGKITCESWQCILENKEHFYLGKAFLSSDCLSFKKLLFPDNRIIMERVLQDCCNLIPITCLTNMFVALGSSVTQWGYNTGILQRVANPLDTIIDAANEGNVVMMALCITQLKKEDVRLELSFFKNKFIHLESIVFVLCWLMGSDEQKERFLSEPFGKHFFDTSVPPNNPFFSLEQSRKFIDSSDEVKFDLKLSQRQTAINMEITEHVEELEKIRELSICF